jgi:hypothetical protein
MRSKYSKLTLTSNKILALKGKPMAKIIKTTDDSLSRLTEEWVYYEVASNLQESYLFDDGYLVNCIKKPL